MRLATIETFAANTRIYNEISDMITSGWVTRQSAYDLISEKQSDATLGYERVYDTETGEVYEAYNGFADIRSLYLIDREMRLPMSGW